MFEVSAPQSSNYQTEASRLYAGHALYDADSPWYTKMGFSCSSLSLFICLSFFLSFWDLSAEVTLMGGRKLRDDLCAINFFFFSFNIFFRLFRRN